MAKTRNTRSTKSQKSSPPVASANVISKSAPMSASMSAPSFVLEVAPPPALEPAATIVESAGEVIADAVVEAVVAPAPETRPEIVRLARTTPSHADIARRAYEIFLRRGGTQGNPLHDWLAAERELAVRAA